MPSAFERFLSGWLTVTIASTSCATVNDLVTNTSSTLRADTLCMSFVADFLWFSLNNCKETRVAILIMTSESCAMMYFAGKKTLPMRFALVSMPTPQRTQFLPGVLSVRGTAVRVAIYSVWENEYYQYSCIIFPHCSTVTAAIQVSADKCQVSY